MSAHVEWMDASATVAERHEAGATMPDGQSVDGGHVAVTFSANEVTVIEGELGDIVALLRHALSLFDGPDEFASELADRVARGEFDAPPEPRDGMRIVAGVLYGPDGYEVDEDAQHAAYERRILEEGR